MKLLGVGTNAKTIKGDKISTYLTAIMYLQPSLKTCPMSVKAGCLDPCLNTAGRGAFNNVQQSRAAKSKLWSEDKETFFSMLIKEVNAFIRKCGRESKKPAVRLNGTSDIDWQKFALVNGKNIFQLFPTVQFYDYTKVYTRLSKSSNYHLTYSYSEANKAFGQKVNKHCDSGYNMAVVFRKELPVTFKGRPVIDGDLTDLRFLDDTGVIVGLKAKGKARKDNSGFVI